LAEKLERFHGENLFGLEDTGAWNVVARQTFFGPFSRDSLRFLFQLIEFAIEPVIGLFRYRVDAVVVGIVVERVDLFGKWVSKETAEPTRPGWGM
jgi:hypothetical protein